MWPGEFTLAYANGLVSKAVPTAAGPVRDLGGLAAQIHARVNSSLS